MDRAGLVIFYVALIMMIMYKSVIISIGALILMIFSVMAAIKAGGDAEKVFDIMLGLVHIPLLYIILVLLEKGQ